MNILIAIYAFFAVATFIKVLDLATKTGILRSLNYIGDIELKDYVLKKRDDLVKLSLIFGSCCIASLLSFMWIYSNERHLIINILAFILTIILIFIAPYLIGRKKPHSWVENIESPPTGMALD